MSGGSGGDSQMVTVLLTTTAGARLLSCEKLQLSPVDRSMIKLEAVMAQIPLLIFFFPFSLLTAFIAEAVSHYVFKFSVFQQRESSTSHKKQH